MLRKVYFFDLVVASINEFDLKWNGKTIENGNLANVLFEYLTEVWVICESNNLNVCS
jgi:hypothetical protein